MNFINPNRFDEIFENRKPGPRKFRSGEVEFHRAMDLYRQVSIAAYWYSIQCLLLRQPRYLLNLSDVFRMNPRIGGQYMGIRPVMIEKIRGSESRNRDFDPKFRPIKAHDQERWVKVAMAYIRGDPMPAIQVILVKEVYFVRDGHHRVSVAKKLGFHFLDAEITCWDIPCEDFGQS